MGFKPARGSFRSRRPVRPVRGESRSFKGQVLVQGKVPAWSIPRQALVSLIRLYLKALGLPRASVTLQLVSKSDSRLLNRRFRAKDRSTDILSFPAVEGPVPKGFDDYLGDLALCLDYAWKERGRFAPEFGSECAFLLLHGLLHLTGRHHDNPAQERRLWSLSRALYPIHLPLAPALKRLKLRASKKAT